jgi:hypothetical protein
MKSDFQVEAGEQSSGVCECCGRTSRTVWGTVYGPGRSRSVYYVHWTDGHVDELGANIDFIIGAWGEECSAADRVAVSLLYWVDEEGNPSVKIVDAGVRPAGQSKLVSRALGRDEVIGTPLAAQIFDLVDAVLLQDERLS